MQLLDRYLDAMRVWLPPSQRDDVINELSENIRAQAEDKEAELGRSLTLEEESALLKRHGHPMLVGMRYGRPQYLIGPVMFPFYELVIKISLAILAVGHILNAIVLAVGGHPATEVVSSMFNFFRAAFPMIGWMTIVFAVLDRVTETYRLPEKWVANWDPATLAAAPSRKIEPESLWKRLLGVITESTLAIWWLAGLRYPYLVLGPAASMITWGPIWETLYPAFVVLALAGMAFKWTTLLRPPTRAIEWTRLGFKGARLAVMFVLLRAGNLMVAANPANADSVSAAVLGSIQVGLSIGLTIGLIIGVMQLAWESFRLFRKGSGPASTGVITCA